MKKEIKNHGRSVKTKLLGVSKTEGTFYQTVLTRYFQERLLYRLSQTLYRENFLLKGGALMYAHERFAARPTLDIDFLGKAISNDGDNIVSIFREVCSVPCIEDGVMYDVENITYQNITEFKDYHGVRLNIPVKMDSIAQVMTMDIGFGDIVTPGPISLDYPLLLDSLPQANILAYSLETVIAEKMHAAIDLADQNSRMKDYYDLYCLLSKREYDSDVLQEAIASTFRNRHSTYSENTKFFQENFGKDMQLQVRWQAFIKKIKADSNLSFADVVLRLQNDLRPYWEYMKDDEQ